MDQTTVQVRQRAQLREGARAWVRTPGAATMGRSETAAPPALGQTKGEKKAVQEVGGFL